MAEVKRCTKCGEEKAATLEFFGSCKRVLSGLRSECKACRKAHHQATYHLRPEVIAVRTAAQAAAEATEKACTRCSTVYPKTTEHFAADRTQPQGLHCWCRACQCEAQTQRAKAAPEKTREISRRVQAKHGARYRAERKTRYHTDPTFKAKKADSDRKYWATARVDAERLENLRKKAREGRMRRLQTDPTAPVREKINRRAYYVRHREKMIAISAKARASRRSVPGEFTKDDLNAAFQRQGGKCLYCDCAVGTGRGRAAWHADHFIPISRGGTNHAENIVIACQPCNNRKFNKMPWEWMPERFSPPHQESAD